jgi:hypothetical protein
MLNQKQKEMLLLLGQYLTDTTKTFQRPQKLYSLFPDMEKQVVNDNLQMLKQEGYVTFVPVSGGPGVCIVYNLEITPLGITYCNPQRQV